MILTSLFQGSRARTAAAVKELQQLCYRLLSEAGTANSAAIEIGGFAQNNAVLNNRVRGRARAALALVGQNGGTPGNNTFVSNDLTGFQSSLADVFVDAGVTNTVVIGRRASVEDRGSGTRVVPVP